eukprot:s1629_g17.t1
MAVAQHSDCRWASTAVSRIGGSPDPTHTKKFPIPCQIAFGDFLQHYRRFEHWQMSKRHESCRNKLLASSKGLFAVARKPAKDSLDCLEDRETQSIQVVNDHLHWTLQDQPALVSSVPACATHYHVTSDLLVVDGQSLTCRTLVHEEAQIQKHLEDLWSPRWQRHAHTPNSAWRGICVFAETTLPRKDFFLPVITVADWKRAVRSFKPNAATRPCGWTRLDLLNMTDLQISRLLDFSGILMGAHHGPNSCKSVLSTCCKRRILALRLMDFDLSRSPAFCIGSTLVCGQVSCFTNWLLILILCSVVSSKAIKQLMSGILLEFVLRFQSNRVLRSLDLLRTLSKHTTRSHITLSSTSWPALECLAGSWPCGRSILLASTGFSSSDIQSADLNPPLRACLSMAVVDLLWHIYQSHRAPRVLPISFVDNLELLCDRVPDLALGSEALDCSCQSLDLELDQTCLVAWSTSAPSRFAGLDGFDAELTVSNDHAFTAAEVEQLMIVRDGIFFTDHTKSKWDAQVSNRCAWCNVKGMKFHRYTACAKHDGIQSRHQSLFEDWDSLPDCFQSCGLVAGNPWQDLVWEALCDWPDRTQDFLFAPGPGTIHAFTDGTCSDPACKSIRLAAWAVVIADQGPLSCGPLVGLQQCIFRAELTAAISVLYWSKNHFGSIHIWSDNQIVVDHFRALQSGGAFPDEFEHSDLWSQALQLLNQTSAEVFIHKVFSHDVEAVSVSPLQDFCRKWNALADHQAEVSNLTCPPFFDRVWKGFCDYRAFCQKGVRLFTAFVVEIAAFGCSPSTEDDEDFCTDQILPCFATHPKDVSVASKLQELEGQDSIFQTVHSHFFRAVFHRFVIWLIATDQGSATMRPVSLLELYVGFRLGGEGKLPPVSGGDVADRSIGHLPLHQQG